MRLYFLRHGDATTDRSISDFDRELTDVGRHDAEAVASALKRMDVNLTAILASPFKRAAETADIVARQYPSLATHPSDHLTPTSDPRNLFSELNHFVQDSMVLLVGHEPFLSICIGTLISTGSEPGISMKKTSLACVEVGTSVQRGAGVLLWLLTIEQMKLLK
jgi:phosphohistidine phosphatase